MLLGVLESSVTPAFVLVTGAFYTQDEQVNRIAFWVRRSELRSDSAALTLALLSLAPRRCLRSSGVS